MRVHARTPALIAAVRAAIRGEVREAEPLSRYSTYRIGGPATVVLPADREDVAAAVRVAAAAGVRWFALGLGSNLLLPDEGLEALVIRIGRGLDALEPLGAGRWRVGAGLPQPLAARRTVDAGMAGLHRYVGVPGSVGGGIYMNAGCHGGEWSDVVESVELLAESGEFETRGRAAIPFAYRTSGLSGTVVLGTTVQLAEADPVALQAEIAELFRWRQQGTPFNQPCCGSVFRNPGGASWGHEGGPRTAGQLIEAVGLKGWRVGGAEISPMHANYFINTGGATAADVRALMREARQRVFDTFGAYLEPEVKLIRPDGRYGTLDDDDAGVPVPNS